MHGKLLICPVEGPEYTGPSVFYFSAFGLVADSDAACKTMNQ